MRKLPTNFSDILYLIKKIGFSFVRGFFLSPFFSKASSIPFLGKGIKFICMKKIFFGKYVFLGQNGYLDACCIDLVDFQQGVTIRENFSIQCRSGLNSPGKSLKIGKNTYIGPFVKIGVGGSILIGENTQIGSHCSFNAEKHLFSNGSYTTGKISRKGIVIGNNVWIGDGVIILDDVKIGDNVVIGAGSLVNKDIKSNSIAYGMPAKIKV